MTKTELVQKIGEEVCEGCGPGCDCGIELEFCYRIENAVSILDEYLKSQGVSKITRRK
uniref:Uncharacterized protein n=1 Tax=viral metagenome TaxID=1070528 RepID=A0A6M3KWC2_9ZZZZ